jgi:excisionase family DNA binding protein
MDKLLNPVELAEILKVRPGTLYSWINRGADIPYVKIGGTIRFRGKTVGDWVS